jgi:hypothetical protein
MSAAKLFLNQAIAGVVVTLFLRNRRNRTYRALPQNCVVKLPHQWRARNCNRRRGRPKQDIEEKQLQIICANCADILERILAEHRLRAIDRMRERPCLVQSKAILPPSKSVDIISF